MLRNKLLQDKNLWQNVKHKKEILDITDIPQKY